MATKAEFFDAIRSATNQEEFKELHWTGTFGDYLDLVVSDPDIIRTAHQRVYDMVLSFGTEHTMIGKKKTTTYNFFSDPLGNGADAIFGLESML